ncbi:MAG: nuclear transport factor 2 family protein [Gemmatimonadales bacterium]
MRPASDTSTASLGADLIDTFGKGWSRCNVETLLSAFNENARFVETPFAAPLEGIEAIREYWREIPYYQSEVTFNRGEIFVAGPWFSTEFKCTFRRRRTGDWVDARGALFCETENGKISEMRMYWHRWAGGREVPGER